MENFKHIIKLPVFLLLDSYGHNNFQGNLNKKFGDWLRKQRKLMPKENIKNNYFDIYDKSGSLTIDEVIKACFDKGLINQRNKKIYFTQTGGELALKEIVPNEENFISWVREYYSAVKKVPFKNPTTDNLWLSVHFFNGTDPKKLGSMPVGEYERKDQKFVEDNIKKQWGDWKMDFLILQPHLILDLEYAMADLNRIKCTVEIPELKFSQEFNKIISPYPNRLRVVAIVDSETPFKAVGLNYFNADKLTVCYKWDVQGIKVEHTVNVQMLKGFGNCYFSKVISFITYQLNHDKIYDLNEMFLDRPTIKAIDLSDEENTVKIVEDIECVKSYPNNTEYSGIYKPQEWKNRRQVVEEL